MRVYVALNCRLQQRLLETTYIFTCIYYTAGGNFLRTVVLPYF